MTAKCKSRALLAAVFIITGTAGISRADSGTIVLECGNYWTAPKVFVCCSDTYEVHLDNSTVTHIEQNKDHRWDNTYPVTISPDHITWKVEIHNPDGSVDEVREYDISRYTGRLAVSGHFPSGRRGDWSDTPDCKLLSNRMF
jgi:hypothetical protein